MSAARNAIPLPRRMAALQRDRRGYPVPFVVLRDTAGTPCFTVNDHRTRWRCIKEGRCAICGNRIKGEPFWFVGGPLSAFHKDGAYRDTGLHHDCMTYAMQVCPYLALRNYLGRIDDATVDYDNLRDGMTFFDPTQMPERPKIFVAVASRKQILLPGPDPVHANVRPERPYLKAEFWRNGEQLSAGEAEPIIKAALESGEVELWKKHLMEDGLLS